MSLDLYLPWDRQPTGQPKHNRDHPLYPRLIRAVVASYSRSALVSDLSPVGMISTMSQTLSVAESDIVALEGFTLVAGVFWRQGVGAPAWETLGPELYQITSWPSDTDAALVTRNASGSTKGDAVRRNSSNFPTSYAIPWTAGTYVFTEVVVPDTSGPGTLYEGGLAPRTMSRLGAAGKWSTGKARTIGVGQSTVMGTHLYLYRGALTDSERMLLRSRPWDVFAPRPLLVPLVAPNTSGGTTTTSLSAAIQIARSATAGMNVAVQAGSSATAVVNAAVQQARTASVSLAAAVQEARSTTTSLNAAVQAATSTGASVNTAVQAPASASASLNTAVQLARSATPSVDAAVQAQGTAAASVNAAVQAGQGASSAVDVAIQQARAATASINTAVQASQTAAASIDAAVQAVGSATVGLNTYVQSDGTIGVSLNAAIQAQQQASAGLNLAVQLARSAASALDVVVALAQTASVSLNAYIQAPSEVTTALNAAIQDARSATISVNAAVQVQRTAQVSLSAALAVGQMLTAAVDVAVRAARSRSASLSAYIFDDSAPIPQRDFMRDISSFAAAPAPISATLLGTSIRIHPR